jgi:PAS domain S-box-containing protein
MLDREMRHVAASLRWLEAFSLKEEEIIGRSHYEVVPYVPEHWKEAHRRGMAGEVVRVDAELFKGPDGTLVWTRYEVMPWRTGNGDVGGIIIFGEDITERKAAQEALEKAEQKFREIFEAAPEGIFQTTPTGKLLAVNPAGANMLGYSTWEHPDSVVRDLARDIWLDHRERARFMEHLERHGEIEGFSCQVKCKDGSAIWVSISARKICGEDGKTLYYQGFIEDLTSRMAAEEARRKAEQQFRDIFEVAPEGIFQITPEGRALAFNPAAAEMLGYESAEEAIAAIQNTAHDLWSDSMDCARFIALLEQQGTVRDYQHQLKRRDGSLMWASSTVRKIRGPDGKTICYQGFTQDFTEKKRLEAALQANSRELELLSEINNALVRAKTEKDLLRNCCRIIVEIGGYRMAWVGFADEGPDKPIVTIADYGCKEDFLEGFDRAWADTGHEDGPVGRSLRTGEVQVEEDICADPLVHSWRTEAVKQGYRMAIALPFRLTDGAVASLAVFGETPGIRTGSERRLMEQIASELAYGIETQRAEIAKARHEENLRAALEQTIHVIAETVDQRDPYTAGHERRVADLCMRIAQKLGLPDDRTHGLHLAASIHDLGKIGIPAEILSKPGLLTPTQFNMLKEHAQLGYDVLKNVAFPWPIADIILQHHERLDGSGYPHGLKADAISLEARILAVADVVEAMSSHRPYRASKGVDAALDEILAERGTLYDAQVADACARVFHEDGYEFPAQAS